jgi:hypothetical protein
MCSVDLCNNENEHIEVLHVNKEIYQNNKLYILEKGSILKHDIIHKKFKS